MEKELSNFKKEMEKKQSSMEELLTLMQKIEGKGGFSTLMLIELEINSLQREIKTESVINESFCKKAIKFEEQIKKLFEDFIKENNLEVSNER